MCYCYIFKLKYFFLFLQLFFFFFVSKFHLKIRPCGPKDFDQIDPHIFLNELSTL